MVHFECDVVVIGGGSTGAGCVRDVAMRGLRAILVERADLAQGTSGRFHGLLHSGGRYVVSDPQSATECAEENEILRRIHPDAVEDTGGLFVVTPEDDDAYGDQFLAGCHATGVPVEEISPAEALRREPRLNPGLTRAFAVRDGSVDGWAMVRGCVRSAEQYGATTLTYHRAEEILREGDHVTGVRCTNEKTGEEVLISCRGVINAGGPWAGTIADSAGCPGLEVVSGRGIMVAMNHRLVNTVINRCIYPSDGDILVPAHTVSIIGTTDQEADDPDYLEIPSKEIQQMLDAGEILVPGFRQSRAVHAWAGARPLVKDSRVDAHDTRHMSRGMLIVDHSRRDGLRGFFSIIGGKLTTYRLMAEKVVDQLCEQMGHDAPCRTATEAVPTAHSEELHKITDRLADREDDRLAEQTLCECELVTRPMIEKALAMQPHANLDDIRREVRLGMGPCQGTFCGARAAGVVHEQQPDADRTTTLLRLFFKNRGQGLAPLLTGQQLHEAALNRWVISGLLDVDHLPASSDAAKRATGDLYYLHKEGSQA
ncbi:anaerobic glycerol-3-phosphate dehydrogenase subunit GlpA [Corynebacterium uterequi]|uniref:glycerol-3-phosphate dehydrogenase n=1 Tax=Corynebacterium uterequi TaxID=1072256 RepID=A0A0G3HEI8_9CORY|nr:anaerobic glycerol-3-phosphate dehydrogenase subunit GlpA [Corynebacterium uterequi]AKK11704.1 glycerol 3-phosphate dehydrogenase (quinone) subunit A [Corynebacterium uterequi]